MSRVYVPAESPLAWKPLLAQPELHWLPGRSAHSLAHAWQGATTATGGFPAEVRAVLARDFALAAAEVLVVIPEHQTPLPGGRAASQTDALVLARTADHLAVIGVEGKVTESFGPTVAEWQRDASAGKQERLAFLLETLGLASVPGDVRYQLLHRTAAALLEARAFHARQAVVLVHSFDPGHAGFADFRAFVALLGGDARPGGITTVGERDGITLAFAWATGMPTA